jgi:hypothetical protein
MNSLRLLSMCIFFSGAFAVNPVFADLFSHVRCVKSTENQRNACRDNCDQNLADKQMTARQKFLCKEKCDIAHSITKCADLMRAPAPK